MRRRYFLFAIVPLLLALIVIAAVLFAAQGGFEAFRVPRGGATDVGHDASLLARGAYLADIGNCAACHTRRGGVAYAGARPFATAYGTLYSSNLTSDPQHGIGDWSLDEFVHTMRFGVSRHGAQYPAFPYAQFALMTDDDLKALYAFLRTIPASASDPPANELEFPASSRFALIGWRMLHERPVPRVALDKGAYLVESIGHCAACHSARSTDGALAARGHLAGGRMPVGGWYAPPLDRDALGRFSRDELANYLRSGNTQHGAAYGPMAEVIYAGLHALSTDDAQAIAGYLQARGGAMRVAETAEPSSVARQNVSGEETYRHACGDCHGADDTGKDGKYPALRDSVAATADDPTNLLRIMLYGAVAPATPDNPLPYSMPPFGYRLSREEMAAVANHVREKFGAHHSALTAGDVRAHEGIVNQ